jgi:hypothetical protein
MEIASRQAAYTGNDVKVLGFSTARLSFLQYSQYSIKAQVLVQSQTVTPHKRRLWTLSDTNKGNTTSCLRPRVALPA